MSTDGPTYDVHVRGVRDPKRTAKCAETVRIASPGLDVILMKCAAGTAQAFSTVGRARCFAAST
jgi:hypothetical protein